MKFTWKHIIALALVGYTGFTTYLLYFAQKDELKNKLEKIRTLEKEIDKFKDTIAYYSDLTRQVNKEQDRLEKIADSLKKRLLRSKAPCKEKLALSEKRAGVLELALRKCKRAKAIQVNTIDVHTQIIKRQDTIIVNFKNIQKINKKEKTRSLFIGAGIGASVILIIALLL